MASQARRESDRWGSGKRIGAFSLPTMPSHDIIPLPTCVADRELLKGILGDKILTCKLQIAQTQTRETRGRSNGPNKDSPQGMVWQRFIDQCKALKGSVSRARGIYHSRAEA